MANAWVLSQKEIHISEQKVGFFRKLVDFGGETADTYLIDNQDPDSLAPQTITVRFDFGYLSLPKGIQLVNYELNENGSVIASSLKKRTLPLTSRFWGKILFNLHQDEANSRIYPQDVELHSAPIDEVPVDAPPSSFHLCDYFVDPASPVNSKHGGCPIPIMYDYDVNNQQTDIRTPIFYTEKTALTGMERLTLKGYYLIPMLLPEKNIIFHAIPDDANATRKLNDEWFKKLHKFKAAENTADFLVIDAKKDNHIGIQRNDEVGITYALNIDLVQVKNGDNGELGTVIPW